MSRKFWCFSDICRVIFFVFLSLNTACRVDLGKAPDIPPPAGQRSAIAIPADLSRTLKLVPGARLELEIFRNQDITPYKPTSVTVNQAANIVEPFKVTLPLGEQALWISEIVVDPLYGRVEIARTQPKNFKVTAGEPLDFSHVALQAFPDDDSDNVPNVTELAARTDPKNPDEKPVVNEVTQLESITIEGIVLQPLFEPQHPTYSGRLAADTTEIKVTVTPKRASASVTINGNSFDAAQSKSLPVPPPDSDSLEIVVNALSESATYVVRLIRDEVPLHAAPRSQAVELIWQGAAQSYTVHRSREPCDAVNNLNCIDDAVYVDAKSPYLVTGLTDGTRYYFRLAAHYPNRATIPTSTVVAIPRPAALNCCVNAIDVAADGTAYIGGTFTQASSLVSGGMVVDNTIGVVDNRFPPIHGTVMAAAPDGAGGWYVGGQFTRVDNLTRYNLVHVLSNGNVDPDWRPEVRLEVDGENGAQINAVTVAGANVIVGGYFESVDGLKRNNLAAISVTGDVIPWDENGTDKEVSSLAANGERLFIGGKFTRVGNEPRHYLAAVALSDGRVLSWNADSAFKQPQSYGFASVYALAVADSILYVGGVFELVANDRHSLFALSTDDATLNSWAPRLPGSNRYSSNVVYAIAPVESVVYIAGMFNQINEIPWHAVAALAMNDDGSLITTWIPEIANLDSRTYFRSMSVSKGNIYLVGGISNTGPFGIALGLGGNRLPWLSGDGFSAGSLNIVLADGSQVFMGGTLDFYHSQPRKHLAAYAADGHLLPWNPSISDENTGQATSVDAVRVNGDTVFVGGHFESIAGVPVRNLAAVNRSSGALEWHPSLEWNPPGDVYTRTVSALATHGRRLYVAGNFTAVDGVARTGLAAFENGQLLDWGTQLLGGTAAKNVTALHIWDSSVLVGTVEGNGAGDFFVADSAGNRGDWTPAVVSKLVSSFATSNDSVFVSGQFDSLQEGALVPVLAFNKADATKQSWVANPNNSTLQLFYGNNVLYFAGNFSSVSNEPRRHLAAAAVPGGSVLNWQLKPNRPLRAISGFQDKIYIGGDFNSIDGVTTGSFAILPGYSGKSR